MSFLKALRGKKHKKLPEEWGSAIKQPVNEGMNFYVKYIGSTLVDQPSSETVTAEAIKTIIAMAKASGKKMPHVVLTVKPSGILTTEVTNGEKRLDVSIYRISYCSADATYDRVVAFIATNKNETLECHAFLTSKKKIAQAAALTISQAFTIAFENWKSTKNNLQTDKKQPDGDNNVENEHNSNTAVTLASNKMADICQEPSLIDLSDENVQVDKSAFHQQTSNGHQEVAFDFDLDDSFSKLAQSRTSSKNGNSFLLPHNVSVNYNDLPNYLNQANTKDSAFFSDDSPDDLFSL
ncbi:Low density lipoprotein receptor adapter protein 1-B [Halotydeus destructor]|nr:Low density lipoprotein receptor adapter protein 1-B [Halotydeus destructor]